MTQSTSFRAKVVSGMIWSIAQSWGMKVMTLVLFMVLARVLEPAQMGVFAAAMAVIGFVEIFVDQGLREAIVQRETITREQVNSAFVINVGISLLVFGALSLGGPFIASHMQIAELAELLQITGIGVLINAMSFSQQAMHRRAFNYRWLAVCSLISTAIAGVLAVILALRGWGAWSLVVQFLVAAAINTAMMWLKPQWGFSFSFDFDGARQLVRYGLNRLATQLLDFANTRYIEIFIASVLGPVALGIYAVGVRVYQSLMHAISSAVLNVAHSGFSRLANDRPALVSAYYKSMSFTAAVAVPVFLLLASVTMEATVVFFGEKWIESAEVMRAMAVMGAVQVLQFYNGVVYNAIGRPSISLKFMIAKTVLTFGALILSRNEGMSFIVYAYVVSQLLTTPPSFVLVRRVIGISFSELFAHVWPFLFGSLLMVVSILAAREMDFVGGLTMLERLFLLCTIGGAVYLGFLLLFAREKINLFVGLIRAR